MPQFAVDSVPPTATVNFSSRKLQVSLREITMENHVIRGSGTGSVGITILLKFVNITSAAK